MAAGVCTRDGIAGSLTVVVAVVVLVAVAAVLVGSERNCVAQGEAAGCACGVIPVESTSQTAGKGDSTSAKAGVIAALRRRGVGVACELVGDGMRRSGAGLVMSGVVCHAVSHCV